MPSFGSFELQPEHRRLLHGGEPVPVGTRAFDLLLALSERRNRVVSKSELLDLVWPGLVVEENNLQVQVSTLRKLLGPQVIATIPGRGYQFTAPMDPAADARAQAAAGDTAGNEVSRPVQAQAQTPAPALTNLPEELPPLYGRETDLRALETLLASHRLVTVVGTGGIGKTSVAQAIASRLCGAFEDGVWVVELAPVSDASVVCTTVACMLRVTLGAEEQTKALARSLGSRCMLIVLDNCEHLLHIVAELAAEVHRVAPGVRLLATSQEPLKIPQEHVYRLGALELPSVIGGQPWAHGDIDGARHAGAVALFEARAHAADPRFRLDVHNVGTVIEICRQLDGIALAIELAAARVPLLGVEGLRTRLDERLRVLTGGGRLALRRHQTLRAALDWSHSLLKPDEQTVFRRLGVFAGTFGLESAQHVAGDATIDAWAVLDHLGALVDKSLVVAEPGTVPRYRLLETGRAFALEKLQQAGETEEVLHRHAQAVLAVFEASLEDEYFLSTHARLERYLPDLDNARAALDWSTGVNGNAQMLIALTGAIAWIWVSAAQRPEGLRRTRQAMACIGADTPRQLEARLMGAWSGMAHPESGPEELAADARAVDLFRALGDTRALFVALCRQGRTLARAHQLDQADAALNEAAAMADPRWPPALRATMLQARAWWLWRSGRIEEGVTYGQEWLEVANAMGEKRIALSALVHLEQSAALLGRWEESVALGRELLQRMRQDRFLRSGIENLVLGNLSMALTALGELDEALAMARAAYPLVFQAGRVMELLDPFALLTFKRGRVHDAARMLGRSDLRYAQGSFRRELVEQNIRDELMRLLRTALTEQEISRLLKEGEALSDEEGVQLGLKD